METHASCVAHGLNPHTGMVPDRTAATELSYGPSGAFRITIGAAGSALSLAVTAIWCAGWLLMIASGVSEIARIGRIELWLGTWLLLWTAGGLPVLAALAWTAGGRREIILIGDGTLKIVRPVGLGGPAAAFDAQAIRSLHAEPNANPWMAEALAARGFWTGGSGPIVFRYAGRTYACGSALDDATAAKLVDDLAMLLPHATTPEAAAPEPSQLRQWIAGYVAMGMLVPALTMPFRLLVTDRAICFCEDPAPPPAKPVDVQAVAAAGRVLLVPIDGYPSDRARTIADHFKEQFGVRIKVEPELATAGAAYDDRRGQLDAGALLSALQARYPEGPARTVIIGLTDADMYIPEARWRYAFSYRRAGRVAVVSSARMDRGCLGLLPVSDDRQLARMRKMVGKNIGVLYFRLPLNRDPRSLLYAYVGGPQELDAMSEYF